MWGTTQVILQEDYGEDSPGSNFHRHEGQGGDWDMDLVEPNSA